MTSANQNVRRLGALTPECAIRINENDLPIAATANLVSVSVTEDVNAPSMFSFTLISFDGMRMEIDWVDSDLFKEGNVVEVQIGYLDGMQSLVKGEITGLEPEFHVEGAPTLTVRGYDRGHRLMRKRKTLSFLNMKDSEIASQIAGQAGLTPNVADTKVKLDYVLQHNQTDMEFLKQRAQRIGYEVGVSDRTLNFCTTQQSQQEMITLRRDVELLEFYPRLSTMRQPEEVAVQGWNPKEKSEIVARTNAGGKTPMIGGDKSGPDATAKAFDMPTGRVSTNLAVRQQAEADQIADAWFKDISLHYVVGDGVCIGHNELRSSTVVEIEGLGSRFSGQYYVTGTVHTYNPNIGYRTAFSVRRDGA